MQKLLLVSAVLLLLAVMAPGAAAPDATTTLEAEDLFAGPTTFAATADCDTTHNSTVSWTASGAATGPYPGTFTLHGSLTVGPQTLPGGRPPGPNREGTVAGPVLGFSESFTIISGATTITGTKTLDPQAAPPGTVMTCQQVSQFPILDFFDGHGTVVEGSAQTRYDARIDGPTGTTEDSGSAAVSLAEINITGSCPTGDACQGRLAGFDQTFTLSDQLVCSDDESTNDDDDCEDDD